MVEEGGVVMVKSLELLTVPDGGGDREFAGGGARWDDRDELGGGAGVERGGDAVGI